VSVYRVPGRKPDRPRRLRILPDPFTKLSIGWEEHDCLLCGECKDEKIEKFWAEDVETGAIEIICLGCFHRLTGRR